TGWTYSEAGSPRRLDMESGKTGIRSGSSSRVGQGPFRTLSQGTLGTEHGQWLSTRKTPKASGLLSHANPFSEPHSSSRQPNLHCRPLKGYWFSDSARPCTQSGISLTLSVLHV